MRASKSVRVMSENHWFSARATKETAHAIGRPMAALVAVERHLWLTLSDMKEKDRVFLMDATLAPSGLYGNTVNSVVDRYQEARKQAAAFQRFLPRRPIALGAAGREQPQPRTSSSYREIQRYSVASRAPPQRDRGRQRPKKSRPSAPRSPTSASLSSFHRKHSGAESLATPSGISRAAMSVVSCRSSVSGHRPSSSKHTRGQSRETGSLSRLFSSVETTAKCISLGPADCRERLSYSVWRSAATFQRVIFHECESRAGSDIRTGGQLSLEEGGHRGGPSSRQRVRVLQPLPFGLTLSPRIFLWSPLTFGGRGSFNQGYGGLQGLSRRCSYSGHMWRCWGVYAPNLRQILWPRSASHSWLFCSLAIAVHSTH